MLVFLRGGDDLTCCLYEIEIADQTLFGGFQASLPVFLSLKRAFRIFFFSEKNRGLGHVCLLEHLCDELLTSQVSRLETENKRERKKEEKEKQNVLKTLIELCR